LAEARKIANHEKNKLKKLEKAKKIIEELENK